MEAFHSNINVMQLSQKKKKTLILKKISNVSVTNENFLTNPNE